MTTHDSQHKPSHSPQSTQVSPEIRPPQDATVAQIIKLQRQIGNQATQRLLRQRAISDQQHKSSQDLSETRELPAEKQAISTPQQSDNQATQQLSRQHVISVPTQQTSTPTVQRGLTDMLKWGMSSIVSGVTWGPKALYSYFTSDSKTNNNQNNIEENNTKLENKDDEKKDDLNIIEQNNVEIENKKEVETFGTFDAQPSQVKEVGSDQRTYMIETEKDMYLITSEWNSEYAKVKNSPDVTFTITKPCTGFMKSKWGEVTANTDAVHKELIKQNNLEKDFEITRKIEMGTALLGNQTKFIYLNSAFKHSSVQNRRDFNADKTKHEDLRKITDEQEFEDTIKDMLEKQIDEIDYDEPGRNGGYNYKLFIEAKENIIFNVSPNLRTITVFHVGQSGH